MLLAIKFREVIFMQGSSATEMKIVTQHDGNTFAKMFLLNCKGVNVDDNCGGCQMRIQLSIWKWVAVLPCKLCFIACIGVINPEGFFYEDAAVCTMLIRW